jgi:uncharacterized protein
LLRVKTYIALSPIHGLGLFAAEAIAKGTVVWEYDPVLDRRVDAARPLSAEAERFAYRVDKDYYIIPGDDARYMNHSETANLSTEPGVTREVATRDIAAGEELTEDYRYCLDWPEWAAEHLRHD